MCLSEVDASVLTMMTMIWTANMIISSYCPSSSQERREPSMVVPVHSNFQRSNLRNAIAKEMELLKHNRWIFSFFFGCHCMWILCQEPNFHQGQSWVISSASRQVLIAKVTGSSGWYFSTTANYRNNMTMMLAETKKKSSMQIYEKLLLKTSGGTWILLMSIACNVQSWPSEIGLCLICP